MTTGTRFVTHSHTEVHAIFLSNELHKEIAYAEHVVHFVKKILYGCSLGNRVRCYSRFPLPSPSPLYTMVLLTMSWPVAPGTSPWADSTHPASNTRGCSPWGEGPGLAGRRYPAAPAATTSRDWKPGWEKGFLSHPVTCRVYLASSSFTHSMQTDQKDLKCDLQPIIPPFTSSQPHYRDALSAHSDPLCLCIRTWLKNTWLTDTFKYGGNQMSKFPNAFAIWEHTEGYILLSSCRSSNNLNGFNSTDRNSLPDFTPKKRFWYFKLFYFSGNS